MSADFEIQLSLRALDLVNSSGLQKCSNPYATVHIFDPYGETSVAQTVGSTEMINNSSSPKWTKVFYLDWSFGEAVHVNVEVYDKMERGSDLLMGSCDFEIGEIVTSKGGCKAKVMKGGGGTISAHVEKNRSSEAKFYLQLRAVGLTNVTTEIFRLSASFFTISRKHTESPSNIEDIWIVVYRSGFIAGNLSPMWKKIKLSLSALCDSDKDRSLMIEVFHLKRNSEHIFIGKSETSVNNLLALRNPIGNADNDLSLKLLKDGTEVGYIDVLEANVVESSGRRSGPQRIDSRISTIETPIINPIGDPTFLNYLSGGCELKLCIGIDFTASNGRLHFT
eukprot:CAMPEP_0194346884 /NCGR_PEP_ID=MMETSP0171-20130528/105677_1 /TAXON_ID=218684 /ORGANISM="Corethron pennatum, Strain L29A3" /LENGTH=335 /DNA_ID=CAMNT_0039114065 /DNA_START=141 /DNA_END=1148 /DNA_ORIENTATION=-